MIFRDYSRVFRILTFQLFKFCPTLIFKINLHNYHKWTQNIGWPESNFIAMGVSKTFNKWPLSLAMATKTSDALIVRATSSKKLFNSSSSNSCHSNNNSHKLEVRHFKCDLKLRFSCQPWSSSHKELSRLLQLSDLMVLKDGQGQSQFHTLNPHSSFQCSSRKRSKHKMEASLKDYSEK